jgi:hypothetical protein
MKNFKSKQLVVVLLFMTVWSSYEAKAQVTIGSDNLPAKGALLELKNLEPSSNIQSVTDAGNITVDANGGGLGLPRVLLVDRKTLEPFISTADSEWASGTSKIKEHHAGLTVYNLTNDSLKNLRQGVYVWNGAQWSMMGGERYFYMPSFNIEVKENKKYKFNLHKEYIRQFKKTDDNLFVSNNKELKTISSLENGDLYASNELDYVITYYDTAVMKKPEITYDGELSFEVTNMNEISAKTFFTILLVVK